MIEKSPPNDSEPSASISEALPEVKVGWIAATTAGSKEPGDSSARAAEELNAHLLSQFPDFAWRVEHVRKRLRGESVIVDPLELLELGCGEKIERGWDFAFVVTGSELLARKRTFTIAVPSSALETAVITTARFPTGASDFGTRLAVLGQFLLGHLLGLNPHEPGAMRRPDFAEPGGLEPFDVNDQFAVRERLQEVADSRLEERRPTLNRLAFRFSAFLADPRGILTDVMGYQPWRQPFRLSKLTAAAFVSTLLLFLGAEAWELGVGMNPIVLDAGVVAAVIVSMAFLYRGQNLHQLTRRAILSEQLARSHLVLMITLFLGMTSLWIILFLAALLAGLVLPPSVISSWVGIEVEASHLAKFAAFSATIGTLVGALGGNMENEDDFKAEFLFDEEA